MDEEQFRAEYTFNNFQLITVANPTKTDYAFQITMQVGVDPGTGKLVTEARHYMVKAGTTERFPGVIANKYLDQMSKLVAQEEDTFKLFADFGTRRKIYDGLILDKEDVLAQNKAMVEFPQAKPQEQAIESAPEEEVAFAGAKAEADRPRLGRPPKVQG